MEYMQVYCLNAIVPETNKIKEKWIRLPNKMQERKETGISLSGFSGGLFPSIKRRSI